MLICFKLRQGHIKHKNSYYVSILPPTSEFEIFCSEEDMFLIQRPYNVDIRKNAWCGIKGRENPGLRRQTHHLEIWGI